MSLSSWRRVSIADIAAGLFVMAIGLFAVLEGSGYRMGTVRSIGPGAFPVALGVLMTFCGIGIWLEAWLRPSAEAASQSGSIKLRAMLAILGAVCAFGLMIDRFGLVPAVAAAVVISTFAEPIRRPLATAALIVFLAIFTVTLFIYGLSMPIHIIGY